MLRPKHVAFALVPLLVVVTASELVLGAVGAGGDRAAMSRGFDPTARYLLPMDWGDGGKDGRGWRTQMFNQNETSLELEVPPKRAGVFRILLFGGSNTQGFREDLLAKFLAERLPDGPEVEVFNFGRKGYGSERVRILFEQALVVEPDLALVYTGHNEFVEKGFQQDLEEWTGWSAGIADRASHLRTFRALVAVLAGDGGSGSDGGYGLDGTGGNAGDARPAEWAGEFNKFHDNQYEDTLEQFERFRENLRAMARAAEERDVAIVFSTAITNMLSAPYISSLPEGLAPSAREQFETAAASARSSFPARFAPLVPPPDKGRPYVWDWNFHKENAPDGYAPPALRPLGDRLAEWIDRKGPMWHPPGYWKDFVRELVETVDAFHARRLEPGERESLEACAASLDEALTVVPDHPELLFRRALVTWLLDGDGERTRELLDLAGSKDRAPRRASELSNGVVRDVAAEFERPLYEADGVYRSRTPDGIIGWEIMLDNCHLQPGVVPVLMYDFAEFLAPLVEGFGS